MAGHPIIAHPQEQPARVHELIEKSKQKPDSAFFYLTTASKLASNIDDQTQVKIAWSIYYYRLGAYDQMLDSCNYRLFTFFKSLTGETEVTHLLQKFIEERKFDPPKLFEIYMNIGKDYIERFQVKKAEDWLLKALAVAKAHQSPGNRIHETYYHLALVYSTRYDHQKSIEFSKYALSEMPEILTLRDALNFAAASMNIGATYAGLGKLDSLLYYNDLSYQELIKWDTLNDLKVNQYLTTIAHNNARVFMLKGQFSKAVEQYQRSIQWKKKFFGANHSRLLTSLWGLGECYFYMEEFEKSEQLFTAALEISNETGMEVAASLNWLGDLYRWREAWEKSIVFYDSAIAQSLVYSSTNDFHLKSTEMIFSLRGKIHSTIHSPSVDQAKLDTLFSLLKESIYFTNQFTNSDFLNQTIQESFEWLIKGYSELDSIPYDKLWEIFNTHKSISLKKELQHKESLTFSLPPEILLKEKQLKDSVNKHLSRARSPEFDSMVFHARYEYERFIRKMETDFPAYYRLKYRNEVMPIEEIMRDLREQQLMLVFFEGANFDFVLQVSNSKCQLITIKATELSEVISELENAHEQHDLIRIKENSRKLTDFLQFDLSGLKQLILLPDRKSWRINFNSLLVRSDSGWVYLGHTTDLLYKNFVRKDSKALGNGHVLAFAHGVHMHQNKLNPGILPGSLQELESIKHHWNGKFYAGEMATEDRFKSLSSGHAILHFAIHAIMDEQNPEDSYLQFYGHDSLSDGKLHAYELYNLNLDSQLAVLSSCNSGKGVPHVGNGIQSLANAFSFAGVKSIVGSRQEVSDVSAPLIMEYFYENLKLGYPKSTSLRLAQQRYLEKDADNITSAPYYWSSFYVIGEDDPIMMPGKPNYTNYLGAVIVLILALAFHLTKSRIS